MRICYIGWGDHIHLERWAGYFANQGHDISVISLSRKGAYPAGVKQYCLKWAPFSYRLQRLYLRYLLWLLRPAVIHVHWAHFASILSGIKSAPVIITAWGTDIYGLSECGPVVLTKTLTALRSASMITCDSADIAKRIENLATLSSGRVEIIQWGVDTTMFTPPSGPTGLAQRLGLAGRPVVLSPRDFNPQYNQETVISAFRKVVKALPNAVLLMKHYNGDADYMRHIEEQIRESGLQSSVFIVDRMEYDALADFYRTGQLLISLAQTDGTPMSMLEGMACGSVPIVSDLPSTREWIQDGWNGRLVPVDNPAILADAIVMLLQNRTLMRTYACRNLDLVQERASQQTNMERMAQIYTHLVGPNKYSN